MRVNIYRFIKDAASLALGLALVALAVSGSIKAGAR